MRVRFLSAADAEVASAALWFESKSPFLGDQFWKAVDALTNEIASHPSRFACSEYAPAGVDARFALLTRFKYVVTFIVEADEIVIVAVSHAARKPGYWLNRLPGSGS